MQSFLFHEVRQLTGLERSLAGVFALYNDRRSIVSESLLRVLDDAAGVYRDRGREERAAQFLSLKAEIVTAQRSVHPVTLEKVSVRRNEMQTTIAFKVLQAAEAQLRADLESSMETLQRARDLLGQIIVVGVQKGLLTDATIAAMTNEAAIEAWWTAIGTDADIALAQKRVLLLVSRFDVFLLAEALFSALSSRA